MLRDLCVFRTGLLLVCKIGKHKNTLSMQLTSTQMNLHKCYFFYWQIYISRKDTDTYN